MRISDFVTEAQKAVDSMLNHPLRRLRDDLQTAVQAQQEFRENILASAQSVSLQVEAAQTLAQKLAPEFEAAQRLAQKLAPAFEAAQTLAQKLAPAFEAAQRLAREREALLASVAVPFAEPRSNVDWSVISRRPRVRKPSFDVEPSSARTIVRPEVKRKIGFIR
jgi:hypothetical protein